MYNGYWEINKSYRRGDVVYVATLAEYYVCIKDHLSDQVTFPNKEDLYWVYLSNNFLNFFRCINQTDSGILDQNIQINNNDNQQIFVDNLVDNLVNNVIKSEFDILYKTLSENEKQKDLDFKRRKKLPQVSINRKILSDDKEFRENVKKNELKRKVRIAEDEIANYKRQKMSQDGTVIDGLRNKLLCMDLNIETKSFLLDKYESAKDMNSSDYSKTVNWLKTVVKIPYGKYKGLAVNSNDSIETLQKFFKGVKEKLDRKIHGLENVKQEILEFVARKITNPDSKGHVLALYGNAGTGKTAIIRSLASALDLPFYQINFGGLNDVSVLTGHSETYIGSKPGKIAEIFTSCNYMNPIIYLDEIDKVSESKSTEIFGILTHLLDEEQNSEFQDNYLSNVTIDLSKVFFVVAFNDISKVDSIVSDRLKIIYIDPPSIEDKILIAQDKMIPSIIKTVQLKGDYNLVLERELIEYIITCKTSDEKGVRQLRKNIEKILNRLNYDILIDNLNLIKKESDKTLIITKSYIDQVIKTNDFNDKSYLNMYI